MTNLLQFTINVRKSHRQSQCVLHLACEDRVFFVLFDLHISLCWQQNPKCERVIRLMYPRFFCKLHPSSNHTNENLAVLGLEIQKDLSNCSALDTLSLENFFLQWTILSPLKLLNSLPVSSTISSSSSVICQTTGPKPLPKRFLHIVRSRASSFIWQYPLLFLKSSSSFLRLLPRLLVTSICPFIFP